MLLYNLTISLFPSPVRKILHKILSMSKHLSHTDNTIVSFKSPLTYTTLRQTQPQHEFSISNPSVKKFYKN